MHKMKMKLVLTVLLLTIVSGCANTLPAQQVECPKAAPAPASVMAPVKEDFVRTMQNFLYDTQDDAKPLLNNSVPAKQ